MKKKKAILILGDSMEKHVEGWKLSKNVDRKHEVYVRGFPLGKVKCMKDYTLFFISKIFISNAMLKLAKI